VVSEKGIGPVLVVRIPTVAKRIVSDKVAYIDSVGVTFAAASSNVHTAK
jgi:hypothetical protein